MADDTELVNDLDISGQEAPGIFYLGVDGTLYRLDDDTSPRPTRLSGGSKEDAVCQALLLYSLERFKS